MSKFVFFFHLNISNMLNLDAKIRKYFDRLCRLINIYLYMHKQCINVRNDRKTKYLQNPEL